MKLIEQVTLYFKQGNSDKVYEVDLCEVSAGAFVVNFRFGRRDGALKDGSKTVVPLDETKASTALRPRAKETRCGTGITSSRTQPRFCACRKSS